MNFFKEERGVLLSQDSRSRWGALDSRPMPANFRGHSHTTSLYLFRNFRPLAPKRQARRHEGYGNPSSPTLHFSCFTCHVFSGNMTEPFTMQYPVRELNPLRTWNKQAALTDELTGQMGLSPR
jgi:hypothetical protein